METRDVATIETSRLARNILRQRLQRNEQISHDHQKTQGRLYRRDGYNMKPPSCDIFDCAVVITLGSRWLSEELACFGLICF